MKLFKALLSKTPPEVLVTLNALESLRSQVFGDTSVFVDAAADTVFASARKMITDEKDKTVYSISSENWKPRDLALLIVSKVAASELSSGHHHIYRGTLSGVGQGYMAIFTKSGAELAKSGFITDDEAQEDLVAMRNSIKEVG